MRDIYDLTSLHPNSHDVIRVSLHGASVEVSYSDAYYKILEYVFGAQGSVSCGKRTLGAWQLHAVESADLDAHISEILRSTFESYQRDIVKRWGGDSDAVRLVSPDALTAYIVHRVPFHGITIFSGSSRTLFYLRKAREPVNIPHLEHLTKYALRTQLWTQGHVEVHSAICIYRGKGVLIVGQRRAGKTTLAMNLLARGGRLVGSDFGLIDNSWAVRAMPHMCRIAPGTVADNPVLEGALGAKNNSIKSYLDGPVFFDAKFELYATAVNAVFGRNAHEAVTHVDHVLFPQFSLSQHTLDFDRLTVDEGMCRLRRAILEDRPLPDWLPFDAVLSRLSLEREVIDKLPKAIAPKYATLRFGPTDTVDWAKFDKHIDASEDS